LATSAQCQQTAEDWYNKGNVLLNLGEYNESISAYNKAIELNQSLAVAWKQKGNAFLNLTKYYESLKCYDNAIKLDPNYASAWNNKGVTLKNIGEYDAAINAWNKAIELDPKDAQYWYNKGIALNEYGKYDEAAKAFEEASRLYPKNSVTWNAAEYALSHIPDWMEITSYEQGRGINCYIKIYNIAGKMIKSDGTLRIEIFEDDSASELWSKSYSVNATDFIDTTAGLGPFAHPVTIWHTGRISYDTINPGLGDLSLNESVSLEIRAYFETKNGQILKDKTSNYVS
jgi:tetratricopeptide (TPR) repeat protein